MQPKLTVSGFRGVWGETLTEEIARDYVRAFGMFTLSKNGGDQATILVGRDGRESGPALSRVIVEELLANGFNVIELGMVATPIAVFLVRSEGATGAIIITASHNPIEYNGLKFVTKTGAFTTEAEVAEIESFRGQQGEFTTYGVHETGEALFEKYFTKLTASVDSEKIKARAFKVALDPINSVGCTTTPKLLELFGATSFVINGDPTGKFAHEPEPLPKNLTGLQALVKENACDVGFAQDPDGDRLVVCDENGAIPSEEIMLALCMKAVLSKKPGTIVINLSTSNMSEDIATAAHSKCLRSKVGEANVVEMMQKENAVAGGEGGGGIIWPEVNTARDSYVGIALILELMAHEGKKLSEIIASLPKYGMFKEKMAFSGDLPLFYEKLVNTFPSISENRNDGLRLDFPDRSWIHVRPSNTEPVVRIIAEGTTTEQAEGLIQRARSL